MIVIIQMVIGDHLEFYCFSLSFSAYFLISSSTMLLMNS